MYDKCLIKETTETFTSSSNFESTNVYHVGTQV